MLVKNVVGDELEVYRGICVRWQDRGKEQAGMLTGIVVRIDDQTASVLDVYGNYYNVHPAYMVASMDKRTQDLSLLDEDARSNAANEYADRWIETRHFVIDEDGESKPVARKNAPAGRTNEVMKAIEDSQYPARKSDIVATVKGITDSEYIQAIRNLLNSKRIVQFGKRRGASYGLPGKSYEDRPIVEKVKTPREPKPQKFVDVTEYVEFITNSTQPLSRSDLRDEFNFTQSEWVEISAALKECDDIVITGAKRGTRYQGR